MDERIVKWLYDIQEAINEIESYFVDKSKDFNHYQSDVKLKRAIERDLEIIGEAVNRILKANPEFPLNNAKRIVGLRNQIIHGYDNISDENIWAIISKHIPDLNKQVKDILDKES